MRYFGGLLFLALFADLGQAQTAKTPVVLINGFQLSCADTSSSLTSAANTFGSLPSLLQSDGLSVTFFNNCAYGTDVSFEQLGNELKNYLASLKYADGTPVTQVDVVAHSAGSLI